MFRDVLLAVQLATAHPAEQAVNTALASLGYPALPCPILEAMTELPDLYLHPGIENFEYPDCNSKVQYIGALPTPAGQPKLPARWHQIDRTKRFVAGIDLRTNQATPEAIKHAVDEIFTQPGYRERALLLSLEFASHDVEAELLSLIEKCVPETVGA